MSKKGARLPPKLVRRSYLFLSCPSPAVPVSLSDASGGEYGGHGGGSPELQPFPPRHARDEYVHHYYQYYHFDFSMNGMHESHEAS